jgi:hypothetical protein
MGVTLKMPNTLDAFAHWYITDELVTNNDIFSRGKTEANSLENSYASQQTVPTSVNFFETDAAFKARGKHRARKLFRQHSVNYWLPYAAFSSYKFNPKEMKVTLWVSSVKKQRQFQQHTAPRLHPSQSLSLSLVWGWLVMRVINPTSS